MGKNLAVPLIAALFAFVVAIPVLLVVLEGNRLPAEPVALLALFVLLFAGVGATAYTARCIPLRREIAFSQDCVVLNDVYLLGRSAKKFAYPAVKGFLFSVHTPWRSLFKLTDIVLQLRGRRPVMLIHGGCPMYSWQGREAYAALSAFLVRCGRAHLLAPEPNFSWLAP